MRDPPPHTAPVSPRPAPPPPLSHARRLPPPPSAGKNLLVIEVLAAHGANERAKDVLGKSPLDLARYVCKNDPTDEARTAVLRYLVTAPGDRREFVYTERP